MNFSYIYMKGNHIRIRLSVTKRFYRIQQQNTFFHRRILQYCQIKIGQWCIPDKFSEGILQLIWIKRIMMQPHRNVGSVNTAEQNVCKGMLVDAVAKLFYIHCIIIEHSINFRNNKKLVVKKNKATSICQ